MHMPLFKVTNMKKMALVMRVIREKMALVLLKTKRKEQMALVHPEVLVLAVLILAVLAVQLNQEIKKVCNNTFSLLKTKETHLKGKATKILQLQIIHQQIQN